MTHVVTQDCIGCRDMACANACPMECFHVGPEMLYIDAEDCIDCQACVPECPAEAIYIDDELPEKFAGALELNAKMVKVYPRQT